MRSTRPALIVLAAAVPWLQPHPAAAQPPPQVQQPGSSGTTAPVYTPDWRHPGHGPVPVQSPVWKGIANPAGSPMPSWSPLGDGNGSGQPPAWSPAPPRGEGPLWGPLKQPTI